MGTRLIEVGNIGLKDACELLLVEDEQVVEETPFSAINASEPD
jgi:hypothetical protein